MDVIFSFDEQWHHGRHGVVRGMYYVSCYSEAAGCPEGKDSAFVCYGCIMGRFDSAIRALEASGAFE